MIEQDGFGEDTRKGRKHSSADRRLSAGLIGGAFSRKGRLRGALDAEDVGSGAADESFTDFDSDPTGTFASLPIGGYLRKQRILRGISVEELSTMTRIPLRSLQRLEGGQFDGETDGFVRGFVRTVAGALGLDEEDTLSRMLQEPALGVWERHSPTRSAKQVLALGVFALIATIGFLILRAGWNVLVGVGSDSGRSEVVLWQDPVRALAESTGAPLDPSAEIDPGSRSDP